jgi:hypothetical protein
MNGDVWVGITALQAWRLSALSFSDRSLPLAADCCCCVIMRLAARRRDCYIEQLITKCEKGLIRFDFPLFQKMLYDIISTICLHLLAEVQMLRTW